MGVRNYAVQYNNYIRNALPTVRIWAQYGVVNQVFLVMCRVQ